MYIKNVDAYAIDNLRYLRAKLEMLVKDNFDGYENETCICFNINPLMLKFSCPYCIDYIIYYHSVLHCYILDDESEFGRNPVHFPTTEKLYDTVKSLLLDD